MKYIASDYISKCVTIIKRSTFVVVAVCIFKYFIYNTKISTHISAIITHSPFKCLT